MIRARIEVVPFGDEEHAETILEIKVVNDMKGNHKYGHYKVFASSKRGNVEFEIDGFDRETGAHSLIALALTEYHKIQTVGT